jgi:hypothetical protein
VAETFNDFFVNVAKDIVKDICAPWGEYKDWSTNGTW